MQYIDCIIVWRWFYLMYFLSRNKFSRVESFTSFSDIIFAIWYRVVLPFVNDDAGGKHDAPSVLKIDIHYRVKSYYYFIVSTTSHNANVSKYTKTIVLYRFAYLPTCQKCSTICFILIQNLIRYWIYEIEHLMSIRKPADHDKILSTVSIGHCFSYFILLEKKDSVVAAVPDEDIL